MRTHNGIGVFIRRGRDESWLIWSLVETERGQPSVKQAVGPYQTPGLLEPWSCTSWAPELWGTDVCYFKSPKPTVCSQPKQPDTLLHGQGHNSSGHTPTCSLSVEIQLQEFCKQQRENGVKIGQDVSIFCCGSVLVHFQGFRTKCIT